MVRKRWRRRTSANELLVTAVRIAQCLGLTVALAVGSGCLGPEDHTYTPLEAAIIRNEDISQIEELLAAGADPNERSTDGGPLGAAVGNSDVDLVRLLLSFGADASPSSASDSSYVVTVAVQQRSTDDLGDVAIAELLVEAGADPCLRSMNSTTEGLRPSEIAEGDGRSVVAEALELLEKNCPN